MNEVVRESRKVFSVDSWIEIRADMPDRNNGNASHIYMLTIEDRKQGDLDAIPTIKFQRGPLNEPHETGVTNEALIAIVIDRLQGFQSSQWACRENALALTKLQEALMWLQERTRQRASKKIEGTSEVGGD